MKPTKRFLAALMAAVMLLAFGTEQIQAAQQAERVSAIQDVFSSFFQNFIKGKKKTTKASDLVVVLDAGHGGSDYGAIGNGLQEKALTLKIAKYCKAELEKYGGVKVYMTRIDDTYVGLNQRIQYASEAEADVFVSIHINSDTTGQAYGTEVYYPNSNYKPAIGQEGKNLASAIQKNLAAVGLSDRGIKILNSMSGEKYPDGSPADYYAVIRGAKQEGYPGVIVEHAFISNKSDAKEFLSKDTMLRKLGAADAKGIAASYGLKKSGEDSDSLQKTSLTKLVGKSSSKVQIGWEAVKGATGYEIYRSASKKGSYKKIATVQKAGSTSYTDNTVKSGKSYYYKVRPYKMSGNQKKTAGFCTAQQVRVLNQPEILIKDQGARLKISWKKIKGASKYEVCRSTSKKGRYVKIATVENVLSFQDTGRKQNQTYYYKVRAVCSGVSGATCSSYSEVKWSSDK